MLFCSMNKHHQIQTTNYYIRLLKMATLYTITLQMATAMLAETMDNSQHSTWPIPTSKSYIMNSSPNNLRATSNTPVKTHIRIRDSA
jgi:hypothetical protein